jgi:AraC-like DNA-binding protein
MACREAPGASGFPDRALPLGADELGSIGTAPFRPTNSDPQQVPRAEVRRMRTREEYVAALGLLDARSGGGGADEFEAEIANLDLGQISLCLTRPSHASTMVGGVPDFHIFILPMAPVVARRTICGRDFPADGHGLFHHRPHELVVSRSRTDRPWPTAAIWIRHDDLVRQSAALAGRDPSPSELDRSIILTTKAPHRRLLRLMTDARELAVARPEVVASPSASRALSGAIQEALVVSLATGKAAPERAAVRRRHQVMARLERLLHEQPEEVLTLPELCVAVGVAERTLHLVCQEFVGVGPMQYARSLRLDRVRRALVAADPQVDRVSAIAMHYGFWALGRFAVAYRGAFGETPSETLRRSSS